ncbi:DNA sulfur modification protein DndE [Nonomuraea sp. ATR24]|uniref:DNA sulfur modification protein DndE n=1 Tax=Nonomuraea sp. ATR24 TaxID=1676744 RepID=UPI0035C0EDF5
MSLDLIRLSQPAKDQLVKLKRVTGIKTWNVLCRWALAVSLADETPPLVRDIVADSNLEMSWRTFAGEYRDVYLALLRQRCLEEGEQPSDEAVARLLSIHLHRGIGYLSGRTDMKSIETFVATAAS